jgi:hypothetical protein
MQARRRTFWLAIWTSVAVATGILGNVPPLPAEDKSLQFESHVVPILRAHCWKCHGLEGRSGQLDLRTLPLLLAGGKSGPAIVPGSAANSLLIKQLDGGEMPPAGELQPTAEQLATLRAWIDGGAAAGYLGGPLTAEESPPIANSDRQWWAFQKPVSHPLPAVPDVGRQQTPVDAFLLEKLAARGLGYSPAAEPTALVRRLFLDLTGLPPAPAEVQSFVADCAPDAFERLVDRLLASPHYGERWGRHWLDAAGYVDAIGTDNDATIIEERERIWKYRDYVIRAFNQDTPFDRFLVEQLAGDELVDWRSAEEFTPEIKELLVATGFLRQAADVTYAPELNTADIRHQVVFDTVQIFSTGVLGLTVQCAQCHTHKFDPLGHADYYRLAAFFAPAYDPQNWKHSKERFLADVSPRRQQAIDAHNADVDRQVADLHQQIAALREPFRLKVFETKLAALPEAVRADTKAAIETPADKRSEVQKYLADKLGPLVFVAGGEVDAALDDAARQQTVERNARVQSVSSSKQSYDKIQAMWDLAGPPRTYLLRRGDFQTPGPEVEAGVPAVLDDPADPFVLPKPVAGASTSGYRTALAHWLVRPDHPLTARVFVNRMWQQHFGRGIVATPDNFGVSGASPSHPELLDWLAVEFATRGWSIKRLQRHLVESSAYRQSSEISPDAAGAAVSAVAQAADPENLLLWRMPLRRLEAESVRDSILAVSGALDASQGGPPVPLKANPDGSVEVDAAKQATPTSRFRRSLYIFSRRNYHLSELNLFDQPVVAHNCTRRMPTAVVLQSLAMLNSPFATEQSELFAQRVAREAGEDDARRIELAFQLALGRAPDGEEKSAARELLASQLARFQAQANTTPDEARSRALAGLCQMLLNSNEFLYVP